MGQTLRESLSQIDPEKREKKRLKRAVNKAKRVAVSGFDDADLEPIPVDAVANIARDDLQEWTEYSLEQACEETNDQTDRLMLDFEPLPVKFNTDGVAEGGLAQMVWTSTDMTTFAMLDQGNQSIDTSIPPQPPQQRLSSYTVPDMMQVGVATWETQDGVVEGSQAPLHRHYPTSNKSENQTDFSPSHLVALISSELRSDEDHRIFGPWQA